MVALLVLIMATLYKKNCWTQKVHLTTRLDFSSLFVFLFSFSIVSVIFELIGPEKPTF